MQGRFAASPPDWVAGYVGLPFKVLGRDREGVDCYGLVHLVLAERFGTRLPSYDGRYASVEDREDLARLIAGEMGPWAEVPAGAERAGDVVLIRLMGQPVHVGVVVARGWMLHVEEGTDAALERYDGLKWRRRVMGIYRYRDLR